MAQMMGQMRTVPLDCSFRHRLDLFVACVLLSCSFGCGGLGCFGPKQYSGLAALASRFFSFRLVVSPIRGAGGVRCSADAGGDALSDDDGDDDDDDAGDDVTDSVSGRLLTQHSGTLS